VAKPTVAHCDQLRAWLPRYPSTAAEDAALSACATAAEPTPELVRAVLETHPLQMSVTKSDRRLESVKPENWPTTRHRLMESLANEDDVIALVNLTADGGAEGFGVSAASLVLAAFRPERFVPFLVPSRRALEGLDLLPKMGYKLLRSNEWSGYLATCRQLSGDCDLRVHRELDCAVSGS
jgi:hypothetical protein